MTRVLVATASKHGATHEIGDAIAAALESEGIEAFTGRAEDVTALDDVDAVILGSGVYAGHWLEPAKTFVDRFQAELRALPVWLFSSGPLGDPPAPAGDPVDVSMVREKSGARDHQVFAGRLDQPNLGFAERAVIKLVRAPYGDFRDWPAIAKWGREIAGSVVEVAAIDR
ncbi:MAG TPA: flavodoxin domain-containing protein [Candidatus Limnocylindria bacterium]|nr:flavodoxin domain-containing protein [Candidatus Limnocylindria bacterium]